MTLPQFTDINGVVHKLSDPWDNDRQNMRETQNRFSENDKELYPILNLVEEWITQYPVNSVYDTFGNIKNFYEYLNFIMMMEKYFSLTFFDNEHVTFGELTYVDLQHLVYFLQGNIVAFDNSLYQWYCRNQVILDATRENYRHCHKYFRTSKLKRILNSSQHQR